jgi:hypothetical protein
MWVRTLILSIACSYNVGSGMFAADALGSAMGIRLLQQAVVYFLIGLGFGIYMAASENHGQIPVHAHVNLLGWASMAICGMAYEVFPRLQKHWLAPAHFWMHSLGLPVSMVGLFLLMRGQMSMAPVAGIGGIVVAVGVLCFAVNVLFRLRAEPRTA